MNVSEYMGTCLHDPEEGYYATRPALGADGDFVTAPEISQVFGEMIGLWAVHMHEALGAPRPFRLVEIGGGSGRLMEDVLRAVRVAPSFAENFELWMVETSPPLRAQQAERLAVHGPRFAQALEEVEGSGPMLIIANELLDCLPARQFVRTSEGWFERVVAAKDGRLVFGLAPSAEVFVPRALRRIPCGDVVELSPAQERFGAAVGRLLAAWGGAALLVDYGRLEPASGSTLQAVRAHRKVDPLDQPGTSDLTVHAEFDVFAAAALATGGLSAWTAGQGAFLRALGAETRFSRLRDLRPDLAATLARQERRLTDEGEMGALFKALAVTPEDLEPPGFGGRRYVPSFVAAGGDGAGDLDP